MQIKPFTIKNSRKIFYTIKRFEEIIFFFILAIQLFQEFYQSESFTYFTIGLSYTGAILFVFGILYKYMASMVEENIYPDQLEIVDFYDSFLGNILIPMIFLFHIDNVIFQGVSIKHLDLAKKILLLVAFLSAVFNRYILWLSKKYSQEMILDDTYIKSAKGELRFHTIIILNYLNAIVNFVLSCFFAYIAACFEWKNALLGEAVCVLALFVSLCVMTYVGIEDKKRICLLGVMILTVMIALSFVYRIFF